MTFLQAFLLPLAALYEVGARVRAGLYETGVFSRKKLPGTVISLGNITVGGTGKTPMVIWLAHALLQNGASVGILTRGYAGFMQRDSIRHSNERQVSDKNSQVLGDEPALIAQRLSQIPEPQGKFHVTSSADRYAAGMRLAQAGFDTFILDDGFQSLYLGRDLDVVLIDALAPFGGGHLLPSGRLREPKSALRRAGLIVITRSRHAPAIEAVVRRYSSAPIFYATMTLDGIFEARRVADRFVPGTVSSEEVRKNLRFFAFCGIGNPANFLESLREWGVATTGSQAFRDHHRYSGVDVHRLEDEARRSGATALICTEKDLMNLDGLEFQDIPLYCSVISLQMQDVGKFWEAVGDGLQRKRGISA